ncbi:MAG: glycosyltransferase family 4 protein [Candidatus Methanoperedens sp.]|nr:glycosyltransferase family 4 protein [Candidatus Methanoperedens sp.]MCE8427028.1 glycosyltransferase family 4 protein [Candidatus Methanoperedens sp.]
MKIAFVYDAVYPWIKGGAEKRIYELGKRLAGRGNEVHVFGIKWWCGPDIIENEGMVLHGICSSMELYTDGRRSISEAIIFSVKLMPHLMKERFDVIDVCAFPYFSCFSARTVSILKRTPMIITWHEVWGEYWYEYLGWKGFFGKFIEKVIARLPDRHIAVSAHTKKELGALGVKKKKITVIPNGIDLMLINDIPANIERCDVIFAGRLIKEKNVNRLIESIWDLKKQLPGIQCLIIGNGPEKQNLVGLIDKLDLKENVKIQDFMDYRNFVSLLKSSGVFVLASKREGFGIVLLEAMASLTPVIAVESRRSAASDIVNGSNGILCHIDEIQKYIIYILTNETLRKEMVKKGFEYVREYDWEHITEKLSRFYKIMGVAHE